VDRCGSFWVVAGHLVCTGRHIHRRLERPGKRSGNQPVAGRWGATGLGELASDNGLGDFLPAPSWVYCGQLSTRRLVLLMAPLLKPEHWSLLTQDDHLLKLLKFTSFVLRK